MSGHALTLTDDELVLLNGRCRPEVQQKVDEAAARIRSREEHPDLTVAHAGFIADAVSEARTNGLLVWHQRRLRACSLCGRSGGYIEFKSGPRRGRPNYDRPLHFNGRELARRSVGVEGYAKLGGCTECIEVVAPVLRDALCGVAAQVPDNLRAAGEPRRVRYENRRCSKCGWTGHEGQMGRKPTLLGDGTYPALCPECGAENHLFSHPVEPADGFTIVVEAEARAEGGQQ